MICEQCGKEFDTKQSGIRCPDCGMSLTLETFEDAISASKYIFNIFGIDILKNSKMFLNLISDVIPKLTREKNLFAAMQRQHIYMSLCEANNKNDDEKKTVILSCIKKLIDNEGLSETSAIIALNCINIGLNWNIDFDCDITKNYHNTSTVSSNNQINKTRRIEHKISDVTNTKNSCQSVSFLRRIDDLGRIVIPKEIRKTIGIEYEDALEFYTKDNTIILKKYESSN